jgi:hypothetical protein
LRRGCFGEQKITIIQKVIESSKMEGNVVLKEMERERKQERK